MDREMAKVEDYNNYRKKKVAVGWTHQRDINGWLEQQSGIPWMLREGKVNKELDGEISKVLLRWSGINGQPIAINEGWENS